VTELNAFVSLGNNDNKILSENNLMNMVWDFPMSVPCHLWGRALKECSTLASQRGGMAITSESLVSYHKLALVKGRSYQQRGRTVSIAVIPIIGCEFQALTANGWT